VCMCVYVCVCVCMCMCIQWPLGLDSCGVRQCKKIGPVCGATAYAAGDLVPCAVRRRMLLGVDLLHCRTPQETNPKSHWIHIHIHTHPHTHTHTYTHTVVLWLSGA
jgi:hypothetical protein